MFKVHFVINIGFWTLLWRFSRSLLSISSLSWYKLSANFLVLTLVDIKAIGTWINFGIVFSWDLTFLFQLGQMSARTPDVFWIPLKAKWGNAMYRSSIVKPNEMRSRQQVKENANDCRKYSIRAYPLKCANAKPGNRNDRRDPKERILDENSIHLFPLVRCHCHRRRFRHRWIAFAWFRSSSARATPVGLGAPPADGPKAQTFMKRFSGSAAAAAATDAP